MGRNRSYELIEPDVRPSVDINNLQSLIEAARTDPLAILELNQHEMIRIRPNVKPYVSLNDGGIHLLLLPDNSSQVDMPGVADISTEHLQALLELGASSTKAIFKNNPHIWEVNMGWHSAEVPKSKSDPKPAAATQPSNMHVHVAGSPEKSYSSVDEYTIRREHRRIMFQDPLIEIGEDLLFGTIIPELKQQSSAFDTIFEEVEIDGNRKGLRMRDPDSSFQDTRLAEIIKRIDLRFKALYKDIGACFFKTESPDGNFMLEDASHEFPRYQLLDQSQRMEKIDLYLSTHPQIPRRSKRLLSRLAARAMSTSEIVERERLINKDISIEEIAIHNFAFIGLVEAFTFTAIRQEDGQIDWIFRPDINGITSEGILAGSASSFKVVERRGGGKDSPGALKAIEEREKAILKLVALDIPQLKITHE